MVGKTLGHYEILEPLGAGGMGEVYRARDTKLDRDVAIKVLPEDFATDADRLARFEREAKLLASLNHANIATIHGLEESDGVRFIAMELVEGETLADRIATSGRIEVDEALEIARQIAEALEAAHENGVIHRDLKPANIKVTPEGKVKVLDFGLAKAYEADGSPSEISPDLSHSPTMAAATRTGVIMGTAAYMSPEQARGKPLDKRADIWAFGCVLYEMFTANKPFAGETVSDTIAAVLRGEPKWEALPQETPSGVRRLLDRCLQKRAERRLRDIGDARIELEDAMGEDAGVERAIAAPHVSGTAFLWRRAMFQAIAVGVLASVLGFILGRALDGGVGASSPSGPSAALRAMVELPESALLALGTRYPLVGFESRALAISPNGRHLVYVGRAEEGTRLYHHDLARFEAPRPLPGTEGANHAFFAPSSEELAFLTEDRVKTISLAGGGAETLCQARTPIKGSWIGDTIYYTDSQGLALASVPAGGGDCIGIFDSRDRLGRNGVVSQVLPDERAVLVTVEAGTSVLGDYAEIWVVALDGSDDAVLPVTGFDPRFLASGHLLFARGGSLFAVALDPGTRQITGESVVVLEGVASESLFGNVHIAVADNGTVAYVPGRDLALGRLAWSDRDGNSDSFDVPEQVYNVFDLAPDDRRFALQVPDVQDYVWLWSAAQGGRRVARSTNVGWPVWSPDGTELAMTEGDRQKLVVDALQGGLPRDVYAFDGGGTVNSWVADRIVVSIMTGGIGIFDAARSTEPIWCRSCGELFYRDGNRVLASRIRLEPELEIETPQVAFEAPDYVDTKGISFRVSSDGRRLYYVRRTVSPRGDRIHIITNWFAELTAIVPARQ